MAKRVTPQDIEQINEMYYVCQNYAEVARKTGWSSSTVAKYVDKNYVPKKLMDVKRFDESMYIAAEPSKMLISLGEWGDACVLSEDEYAEIVELWEEMTV